MENIIFLNRKREADLITKLKKDNFFIVVKGRRRIGKTTFLRKFLPKGVYLFIWPNKSLGWVMENICTEHSFPKFKNFKDLLAYLLEQKKIVILDEFQNFLNVDKSVYGEIQKVIDERKARKEFYKIAVAGSSYSLMNKVFNDVASPLYGRRTAEIVLDRLPVKDLFLALNTSMEKFVKFWAVFEGVPYYYELIDLKSSPEENFKKLILGKEAQLQDEGKVVLSVEFGRDSKTYMTVLSSIAEGKTKLNEIASMFENKTNEVGKYLDILRNEFKLVRRVTPLLADPQKSKEGHYEVIDNFLDFWFCFVDKKKSYLEQERFEEVESFFGNNFNSFVGRKFEKFILSLVKSEILKLGFKVEKAGRQWGSLYSTSKNKNQYEIDLCGVNEKSKKILFGECKWEEKADAEKLLKELKEKARSVVWNNTRRKEYYCIFARSFKAKKLKEKNLYLFDLGDLEKILKWG
ncbi:MAG: ATP-binding protein [Nanoarchaeota archaeon]